jgi:dienelactone hydrolase
VAGGRSGRVANALIVVIIVGTLIVLSGYVAVFLLAPPGGFRLSPSIGGGEAVYAAIPTSTPTPPPTYPFPPTWTPFPTGTPLPPPNPTYTPYPTAIPRPTSTPDHRFDNTIVGLRARHFPGGKIRILDTLASNSVYVRYLISYPSDGLTITGVLTRPRARKIYPVIILNHGYYDPADYTSGRGTEREAIYLARQGYLTIAPDYRNYGGSSAGADPFHVGYAKDVLNLIGSLHTYAYADSKRVGVWGHSMGGGVTLRAMVVSERIQAVVVFAPVSADESDNMGIADQMRGPDPPVDRATIKLISPINYLRYAPPLQIHHGAADGTVPLAWSEKLARAMDEAGKHCKLYVYSGQGHVLKGNAWIQAMERTVQFFDQYVKGE